MIGRIRLWWEKNKTRCLDRDLLQTKLVCMDEKVSSTLVRDVSTDTKIRTHICDLDKAFDRNCVRNSCDNTDQVQSMARVIDDTKKKLQFGFMPAETLQLYTGDPVYYQTIPDIISTHLMIRNSGLPNFLKCHIPVTSKLNVDGWCFHLFDYWDQQLPDLLEYGFPIDFKRASPL